MKKAVAILFLLLLLLAATAGVYFQPHLTLIRIKDAIKADDADAFEKETVFPTLRQSLTAQLGDKAQKQMPNLPPGPGRELPLKLRDALQEKAEGAVATLSEKVLTPAMIVKIGQEKMAKEPEGFRLEYISASEFHATILQGDGKELKVILSRVGMSWKMTGVHLPE